MKFGEFAGGHGFSAAESGVLRVGAPDWMSEDVEGFVGEVDHPELGDPGGGIDAGFGAQVPFQAAVGHLDDELDLLGLGVAVCVEVVAVFQHGEIGQRFGIAVEVNGSLGADERSRAKVTVEEAIEAIDGGLVSRADGHDIVDFAVEEFHPAVARTEVTVLGELMEGFGGQALESC